MKSLKLIVMAILAVFMCVACSKDQILPKEETKCFSVGLGITGEYLEISDTPLATRSTSIITTDTYGINVYELAENGDKSLYATGCFTSLDDVKIKLWEGKKYKFDVGIYINDQVESSQQPDGSTMYASPGLAVPGIHNEFSYDPSASIGIYDFMNDIKHDYFYGELAEYTPSQNSTVEIATKRTVYGAHYIAENLAEGSLNIVVSAGGVWGGNPYTVTLTDDTPESNEIYCFYSPVNAWNGNADGSNYSSTKSLTLKWTKDDGSVLPLGEYSVTFKRNIKTTIKIKVKDQSDISNGIVITREETVMTDDSDEYHIDVEDGTVTEIPVTNN